MKERPHSIQKHTFDITYRSQSKAWELQNKFARFIQDQLLPIVDQTFTEQSPQNALVRINKLELDLGEVRAQYFEKDILDKFKSELIRALQAAIAEVHSFPSEGNEIITQEISDADLIIHFLEKGNLPWWSPMAHRADFSIQKTLQELLDKYPDQALGIFRRVGHSPKVQARLAKQFSDKILMQWIEITQPDSRGSISNLVLDLNRLFSHSPFLKMSAKEFRELVWQVVFAIMVSESGRSYDIKSFLREVLLFVSQRRRIKVLELVRPMYALTHGPESKFDLQSPHDEILLSLLGEFAELDEDIFEKTELLRDKERLLAIFNFYLTTGRVPSGTPLTRTQLLARVWKVLIEKLPGETVEIVKESWQGVPGRRRIMEDLEERQFTELIEIAEPSYSAYIIGYARDIGKVDIPESRVPTQTSSFQRAKWEFILDYLFIERGSEFNRRAFLKSTLMQISKRYNVDYGSFLRHLLSAIGQLEASAGLRKDLPVLLSELYQEYEQDQVLRGKITTDLEIFYSEAERLELIRFFLVHGYVAWTDRALVKVEQLEALIADLLEKHPDKVRSALISVPSEKVAGVVQRITAQLSPELIKILQKVIPELPLGDETFVKAGTPEELPEEGRPDAEEKEKQVWYFVEYGEPLDKRLASRTLEKWLLELMITKPRPFFARLQDLQSREEVRAIWVSTFSEYVLSKTAYFLQPVQFRRMEQSTDRLLSGFLSTDVARRRTVDSKQLKWSFILEFQAIHPGGLEEYALVRYFLDFVARKFQERGAKFMIKVLEESKMVTGPQELEPIVEKLISELRQQQLTEGKVDEEKAESEAKKKKEAKEGDKEKAEKEKEKIRIEEERLAKERLEEQNELKEKMAREESEKSEEERQKEEREKVKKDREIKEKEDRERQRLEQSLEERLRKEWEEAEIFREPIYISNAGLVLFHPFLNQYFELLKLTSKRKFIDEQAAVKAVHLLQYLARKTESSPEYELALNKIMCGIGPDRPIEKDITFSDEEIETSDSLVQGVIENWPVLKSMDPDQFRVSFLHREGKLEESLGGWSLTVEKRAYDVLMDKLPWSVQMVKLPWMKKMMHVQWQ